MCSYRIPKREAIWRLASFAGQNQSLTPLFISRLVKGQEGSSLTQANDYRYTIYGKGSTANWGWSLQNDAVCLSSGSSG